MQPGAAAARALEAAASVSAARVPGAASAARVADNALPPEGASAALSQPDAVLPARLNKATALGGRWSCQHSDGPRLPKVSESQSGKANLVFGTVRKEVAAKAAQELYGRVAQRKGRLVGR